MPQAMQDTLLYGAQQLNPKPDKYPVGYKVLLGDPPTVHAPESGAEESGAASDAASAWKREMAERKKTYKLEDEVYYINSTTRENNLRAALSYENGKPTGVLGKGWATWPWY